MFVNKELCIQCKGKCCKTMPGCYFPEDFGLPGNVVKLQIALLSGKIAIDWWDGDPRYGMYEFDRGYFVRPAIKDKIGVLYDPSWGGECIFLTDAGCKLPENERPLNCRKLEPKENGNCILHDNSGKREAAIAWLPYYELLGNHKGILWF